MQWLSLLGLLGRVPEFHNDLKKGIWHRSIEDEDMWTSVRGKKAGIIGYGAIGSNIAKLLKPFGCYIIGYKRNAPAEKDPYSDEITNNLKYAIDTQPNSICDAAVK